MTIGMLYEDAQEAYVEGHTRNRYWAINRVFSALIDADKKKAAMIERPSRRAIPRDLVDRYVASLSANSRLHDLRRTLYTKVDEEILGRPLDELHPARLTLTAPTGSGKTLTALNAALKLRARVEVSKGYSPRIIYVLPFITLIEQNHDVFHRVLQQHPQYLNDPRAYLVQHHHLASTDDTEAELGEFKAAEESLMLAESWDAEIIVTTFLQLFHTLVGFKNRFLKKLHNVEGSILILDEPQSLPAEYWPLVRQVLGDLEQFGVTVLCMTATQPRILPNALEVAPRFPQWPHRVQLKRRRFRDINELAEEVASASHKSRLVVMNTIRASIELYRSLAERKVSPLYYLSTNITPFERRKRIETIRSALEGGEPVTLVSTQVVEAGVDVDFDVGYREIGPLDSVIQVAGRVNRNCRDRSSHLHVFDLGEDRSGLIYGRILPELTRRYLPESATDQEVESVLGKYYRDLEKRISGERAGYLLEALCRLRYDDSKEGAISSFRLIKDAPSIGIFVELNAEARQVREQLEDALEDRDVDRKRIRLRLIRPNLEQFVVSVLEPRAQANMPPQWFPGRPEILDGIRLINDGELAAYYDADRDGLQGTGFKWLTSDRIDSQFIGGGSG